ncbi:MAG: hypothetical protein DSY46_06000 [Hydrogenimonas sp.]|nr:MAG: hypothetical protein DSY46_06000 [Hydrogenimonas sp.]
MIQNINAQNSGRIINDLQNSDGKMVSNHPNIDTQSSRIEDLKKQIERGEYKIDLKATAMKMARELRPE